MSLRPPVVASHRLGRASLGTITALLVVIAVGLLSGPARFGTEPPSAEAALLTQVRKLLASDAQAADLFGWSVAVSGDTAVVGAQTEDAGGGQAGAAYVFQRDQGGAGTWGQVKKILASDAQAGDAFGVSVVVGSDTAVVGPTARMPEAAGPAPPTSSSATRAGRAHLF